MIKLLTIEQVSEFEKAGDAFRQANNELRGTCIRIVMRAVLEVPSGKINFEDKFVEEHDEYIDFGSSYPVHTGAGERVGAIDQERVYSYQAPERSLLLSELDTENWISLVETIIVYQRWTASTGT